MITLSLLLNILVLILVCAGLLADASWVQQSYGKPSPARSILLSVYLAIAISSVILLFSNDAKFAISLLFVQVLYKAITPFTVANIGNPVVISNLIIASFHAITIFVTWNAGLLIS